MQSTMQKKGIDFLASHHLSTLLMTQPANGGFIDVHQHRVTIPIGWGGQLGDVHAQNLCSFLQSIHPNIKQNIAYNNYNQTIDLDALIEKAIKECTTMQSHMNWFVCYGQKPANTVCTVTPPPSVKNMIPTKYPNTATPLASPSTSTIDLKTYYTNEDEHTWDSINDFVDGYTD